MKLERAIQLGYIEVVKEMVNECNINDFIGNSGWTALHYACSFDKLDIVKYLISIGADFNKNTLDGHTSPMDMAIHYWNLTEIKEYFLSLKVVTMEEVCEKFGCNVQIIKGK